MTSLVYITSHGITWPAERDEFIRAYRKFRAQGMPARWAHHAASLRPAEETHPSIQWSLDHNYLPVGTGTVGKFAVRLSADYDDYTQSDGIFTDIWQPGAIQNPDWRPTQWRDTVPRWYVPADGTLDEHRAHYSQAGMSRHLAWVMARQRVFDSLARDKEPVRLILTAVVRFAGIELARQSVCGYDVTGTDDTDWTDLKRDLVTEMLPDAMDEAEKVLDSILEAASA